MRIVLAALAALSLAACSAPEPAAPTSSAIARQGPSSAPTVTTGVDCDSPQITQEQFAEHCASPSTRPLIKVGRLDRFQFLDRPTNTDPVQWRVQVKAFVCRARIGDVKAPDGSKLCVLTAIHKNTGTTQGEPADFDALVTDRGRFAQKEADTETQNRLREGDPDAHYYETWTNPGESKVSYTVWTVPAAAKPTAVLFPYTTVFAGPSYEVALP